MKKASKHIYLPPPSAEGGFINADTCASPDGRRVSGIRKKIQEDAGLAAETHHVIVMPKQKPLPVILAPCQEPPPAENTGSSAPEENVIEAEDNLRVTMDANGFYRSVSPNKPDRIRRRHEELCLRYPDGYRRMAEADGRIVTWQSQKDTEQPPDTVAPGSVNRPPLSTLGDDDETPLTRIKTS